MADKFFGRNIAPSCEYCERGRVTKDGKMVLCESKGIVFGKYSCRKFIYSPLKRIPKRRNPIPIPDEKEFSLD